MCYVLGGLGCRGLPVRVSEIVSGMLRDYESQIDTCYIFKKWKITSCVLLFCKTVVSTLSGHIVLLCFVAFI